MARSSESHARGALTAIAALLSVLALTAAVVAAVNRAPSVADKAGATSVAPLPDVTTPQAPAPAPAAPEIKVIATPPRIGEAITITRPASKTHKRASIRCINSSDSRCGRFYWSPAPFTNQPIELTVEMFPANPHAGEEVTFVVKVRDPDAKVSEIFRVFGDGSPGLTYAACVLNNRYGRWITPAREAGQLSQTFTHVYEKAGTYRASFSSQSGTCGSPYADVIQLPMKVTVEEAPPVDIQS